MEEKQSFLIPSGKIDKVTKIFDKYIKKLLTFKNGILSYTVGEEVTKSFIISHDEFGVFQSTVYRKFRLVTFDGVAPKLRGWEFIARLDHDRELGTMVNAIPGKEVPLEYFSKGQTCDHCRVNRFRKNTFIVYSEVEGFRQVGSTCIADFLGHKSPEEILKFYRNMVELYTIAGGAEDWEDDRYWSSGCSRDYNSLKNVLSVTIAVIRKEGWVSKAKAKIQNIPSTADIVGSYFSYDKSENNRLFRKEVNELRSDSDGDFIEKLIKYFKEVEETNSYLHNVKALAARNLVPVEYRGVAVSMVPTFRKYLGELSDGTKSNLLNEYYGELKQKVELNGLKIDKIIAIEGVFGSVSIYKFTSPKGQLFVWFASRPQKVSDTVFFSEGNVVNLKGSVKGHNEYNGRKETILTRCKLVLVK